MNLTNKVDDENPSKEECNSIASDSSSTYLGRWAELPSSILEKIYSYLDKSDQFNVSLVCKNWSHDYGSPCLWKTFTIDLSKKYPVSELEVWPPVKFARRYGSIFKHIEIKGKPRLRKRKIIKSFSQMKLFFETITRSKCQLLSMKFKNLYDYNRHLNEREYTNFIHSVLTFMRSQHHLQTVEFHNCSFYRENGISFPRLICESIANTLSTLVLKGKVGRGKIGNDLILQYGIVLQNLTNLKILKTDYTVNLENTLRYFCDKIVIPNEMTTKLSLFELHCDGSELKSVRGIPPENWQHLRNICPDLKVQFNVAYSERNFFDFIFAKYIPLVHLEFQIEKAPTFGRVDINHLLLHLCECKANEHLEYLSIVWMPAIQNISIDLIPFLQSCKKLKNFQITISYPVTGLEDLFEFIHMYPPVSLESANFTIAVTDEAGRNYILFLVSLYGPLLRNMGKILLTYSA